MKKQDSSSVFERSETILTQLLEDLKRSVKPSLSATKCSLDNVIYDPKVGFFTPGDKLVTTELNVNSVKKMSRAVFILEIIIRNLRSGAVNTKREIYYIAKGEIKHNPSLKPLDFDDQPESDAIIDFLCELLETYREDLNVFANDRGGQTYSKQLIVTETVAGKKVAEISLADLGTSPFQPKNRPQDLKLKLKSQCDFVLFVESEGTANTLVANGFTERNNCILIGSQGVPSNAVRGWAKRIQDQLNLPMYFFGDLDAYTLQNIFRTLKAGSAASLLRNSEYSAPDVKFLGVLPEDIKKYDLLDYPVKEADSSEGRALKKAKDALENDPFFKDKKNAKLADILKWLATNKRRCEQQSFFTVDPKDPIMPEKIILKKIKEKSYV